MGNNNLVSEWKENFRLYQLTPSLLFGVILFLIFIYKALYHRIPRTSSLKE